MKSRTFKELAATANAFYAQPTTVWRVQRRTLNGITKGALYSDLEEAQLFAAINYVEEIYGVSYRDDPEDAWPGVTLQWTEVATGTYRLLLNGDWTLVYLEAETLDGNLVWE